MENNVAVKQVASAIRKLVRLSAAIAAGELHRREEFIKVRNHAYNAARWINDTAERIANLDAIEAVPFLDSIHKGEEARRTARAAEAVELRRQSRESQPRPGTYEFEIAVYGTGGGR